jgi:capsule polysaccharide modification protein KpsS
MLAWYSIAYSAALTLGAGRYPEYRHHKDLNAWRMLPLWAKGFVRKAWFAFAEKDQLRELVERYEKRFFLVPLQVHHDAQVVNSRFKSNAAFIGEVIQSFAAHNTPGDLLVFKHHPLDRAYSDYVEVIAEAAERAGVVDRVRYVHDLHLPSLLRAARGTVVLNSTTGFSSLHHGTPVKVLGEAVYDLDGLTYQGPLAEFWKDPVAPDAKLYRQFREGVIAASQLNGCFYSTDVGAQVIERLLRTT